MIFEEAVLLWGRICNCTRSLLLDILSGQKRYILLSNLSHKISWSSFSYGLPAQTFLDEGLQHTFEGWQIFVWQEIFKLASHQITKYFVQALRRALCESDRESISPRDYCREEMLMQWERVWFTASKLRKGLKVKMVNGRGQGGRPHSLDLLYFYCREQIVLIPDWKREVLGQHGRADTGMGDTFSSGGEIRKRQFNNCLQIKPKDSYRIRIPTLMKNGHELS